LNIRRKKLFFPFAHHFENNNCGILNREECTLGYWMDGVLEMVKGVESGVEGE
jgi:hypothetical protein